MILREPVFQRLVRILIRRLDKINWKLMLSLVVVIISL